MYNQETVVIFTTLLPILIVGYLVFNIIINLSREYKNENNTNQSRIIQSSIPKQNSNNIIIEFLIKIGILKRVDN